MPLRLPPVRYALSLSEAPELSWRVTRVHVEEALDQPYRAVIDVSADAGAIEEVDTDRLLGCSAALLLSRGPERARALCGLVSRVDDRGHADHRLELCLHIVPALEILRQPVNSRIWQHRSVQEILAGVLEPALGDYQRGLDLGTIRRGAEPRDYCVQYRESDFAFVSRLLEEEGICYEFVHDPETLTETLTLRDGNEQYAALENIDGTAEIPLIAANPGEADVESIQLFECSKQLTATAALRRDFDWMTPRQLHSAPASARDERGRERRIFAHGQRRLTGDDLEERAEDLRLAAGLRARIVRGRSNVTAMRPGLRFTLRGHTRTELEQEYLIIEVVHRGREADTADADAGGGAGGYTNEFECVPYDAPLRPLATTPKPHEYGPQTAIVTGPEGEEIHTDEHGRIQVQFYWQEHPSYAADASCWVRCSQAWAGVGWGAQFIPRVGMEVVVEFLEGNPDRPLVTGCVYNAERPPPFALPEHKTQSGWRSDSSPGGGGWNELRFEDAAGREEIYLHAERDWTIAVEHDKRQGVDHDEELGVGHDRSRRVGHDERIAIGHDRAGEIGHDDSLSVGHDQRVTVAGDRNDSVGGRSVETVGGARSLSVGEDQDTSVGADAQLRVGGERRVRVDKDAHEHVTGDKFVESENATSKTRADMWLASTGKLQIDAGGRLRLQGEDTVIVEAAKKMMFKCGDASITLKPDGKILIKGADVTVKGSGNIVLKGQKVVEN